MRFGTLIALMVALGGCDRPTERVEIADVNARNALSRISELSAKIDTQASEIDDLESEVADAKAKAFTAQNEAESAERRVEEVVDHYNEHLRRWHGAN